MTGRDDLGDGHDPAANRYGDEVAGQGDTGSSVATYDKPLKQEEQDKLFANILRGWDFLKL